ncbi:MAG: diguanylate cyclase (GGDEF)-like protein [Pseudohongiellaceae bacterium]|jgi:diguanylate cyclase (GGDEF)-like protein
MNKRLHQRVACNLPVTLNFNYAEPVLGQAVNYCSGGLLIKLSVSLNELAAANKLNLFDVVQVVFKASLTSSEEAISFESHIRRMDGLLLGIEFSVPLSDNLQRLNQAIKNTPKLITKNVFGDSAQSNASAIIDEVEHRRKCFWSDLLAAFFDITTARFVELAGQSKDNQQQQNYFEALNALKVSKKEIQSNIECYINNPLTDADFSLQQLKQQAPGGNNQLEVLEKTIFEDWLDVQMIIASLESDYFSQLLVLNQYYSQLYQCPIIATNNPISPSVICHTFSKVMGNGQARPIQEVIYHCFNDVLSSKINKFYGELSVIFSNKGFKAEHTVAVEASSINICPGAANTGVRYESHNTYGALQSFKQLQRAVGQEQYPPYSDEQCFSLGDINQWFSTLSADKKLLLTDSSQPLRDVFINIIEDTGLGVDDGRHVNADQLDFLDVVDDIFNLMSDESEISAEIKPWIKQLKVPLLEVALNEPSFFDDPNHPARQVLEKLVHVGSVERVSKKGFESTVKGYISDIVEHYEQDHSAFSRVSKELDKLIQRQKNAFKRNADRVSKIHYGQQKLNRARLHVFKSIRDILVGSAMPKVALELVNIGWKDLLVGVCVREGSESNEFEENIAVLKTITDWCKSESSNVFDIEIEAPAILNLIHSQLEVSSTGLALTMPLLSELEKIFYGEIKAELISINEGDLGFDLTQSLDKVTPKIPARIKEQGNEDRWIERVQRMQVGDWVEYQENGGGRKRMRLAWTGEDELKFVFVNDQGMKEVEFDIDVMIENLDVGVIFFVDECDISFVDKSIFNTVQTVYDQMVFKATHDPLTELVNRHEFEKIIARSLAKLQNNFSQGALCYIDINQFSIVNNNYGNHVGDLLLQVIARRLKQYVGDDVVARVGGNEFGVLMSDCNEVKAIGLSERLRSLINDEIFLVEEKSIVVNVSIGLEMMSNNIQSVTTLLKHANLACRSAKHHKVDRVVLFKSDDCDQSHEDDVMSWAGRVDGAISTNKLQVRCQKIISVNDEGADQPHYEMLLGVTDDNGELTSPEDFIEAAEKINRMPKVDRWMVNSVFEWMENNSDKMAQMNGISINLSGCSINDGRFLKFLLDVIENTTVPTSKICFEVTETATISNLNYAVDFINEVKRTGCKFSLDDFGTGMSSYEYLQKLPVDYLKIDGVFIKDVVDNKKNYALVKSINELGHFLGIETIAEYVEDQEILDVLKEIGVDYAQGYGIEKPVLLSTI